MVDRINVEEAQVRAEKYGVNLNEAIELMGTMGFSSSLVNGGKHSIMLCDYRDIKGYNKMVAVSVVVESTDKQVDRFNVIY